MRVELDAPPIAAAPRALFVPSSLDASLALVKPDAPPCQESTMPLTVIEPACGWQRLNLHELWRFRELIYFLAWRDVKVRYKQTILGAAWAVFQPLLMMLVFTLFFNRMAGVSGGDVPYPLFAFTGFVAWTFFASAIAAAGNSVVGSERLITKVYFPRLAIPFAAASAAGLDFLISLVFLAALMAWYGVAPSIAVCWLPFFCALLLLAALGLGTLLAALNVAYRDFRYALPFLIQLWMFATPTIYMQAPPDPSAFWQAMVALNPLAGLVAGFQAAVLGSAVPWASVGVSAALILILLVVGCLYFRKVEDTFADVI
jgi:lipopolysaccharide transport system permease protein